MDFKSQYKINSVYKSRCSGFLKDDVFILLVIFESRIGELLGGAANTLAV